MWGGYLDIHSFGAAATVRIWHTQFHDWNSLRVEALLASEESLAVREGRVGLHA